MRRQDTLWGAEGPRIFGVVKPAYSTLVLEAEPGLEQSTGLTVVHLLWLEVLDQIELGRGFADQQEDPDATDQRFIQIAWHLPTIGVKNKLSLAAEKMHHLSGRTDRHAHSQ